MLCADVAPSVSSVEVVHKRRGGGYSNLGFLETRGGVDSSSSSSTSPSSSPSSSCPNNRSAETREQASETGVGLCLRYLISRWGPEAYS